MFNLLARPTHAVPFKVLAAGNEGIAGGAKVQYQTWDSLMRSLIASEKVQQPLGYPRTSILNPPGHLNLGPYCLA